MRKFSLGVNGIRYACIEAGEGPLLLLMHGTFGGKALMLPQLEHLSANFRCVAFDWRGHGETGYEPAGWTADDLVEDVSAIIDALGEKRAFLVGVSQGGAVGMRVALKYPGKVQALVNMCGGPGAPPPAALERLNIYASCFSGEQDEEVRRETAIEFAEHYFHAPGFAQREPARFASEIDVILSHSRNSVGFLSGVPRSYVDITPHLSEITCPTLILWAEHDARPQLGSVLASAIPDCRLVMIENAGHHVNVDAPEETSEAIEEFLLGISG